MKEGREKGTLLAHPCGSGRIPAEFHERFDGNLMESIWIFTVRFTGNDTGIQVEIQWIGNSMEYSWNTYGYFLRILQNSINWAVKYMEF